MVAFIVKEDLFYAYYFVYECLRMITNLITTLLIINYYQEIRELRKGSSSENLNSGGLDDI